MEQTQVSHGWVECVGCADRSAYDLECHSKASNVALEASKALAEPIITDVVAVVPNKKKFGPKFKRDAKAITAHLEGLDNEQAAAIGEQLASAGTATVTVGGADFVLDTDCAAVERKQVKVSERRFTPSVIEPSFGIGRILYCLLEHAYDCREGDAQRGFLRLAPSVAPFKCSLLPLSRDPEFFPPLTALADQLRDRGVSCRLDDGNTSVGRRYARTDEIGIPFGITVDFETKTDGMATLRERDSTDQIRAPLAELPDLVASIAFGRGSWAAAVAKYGLTGADKAGADI